MGISVVGGSTTTTQDKTVVYGTPGSYTFTPPAGTSTSNPLLCEVTVIGAGGGGGNYNSTSGVTGTGGGAGSVIQQKSFYVTGPTSVTVGAGGAAATAGGNSVFGGITAPGGAAGATSNSATAKNTGTDDCTKGAAGVSALALLLIGRESVGNILYKDFTQLATANGATEISKPPLTNPTGAWSVAANATHIVACNTTVNGTSAGGNVTAFYRASEGWTIRSTITVSPAQWAVATINGTAVCMSGSSGNSVTYYYSTTGNSWTQSSFPNIFTAGNDYQWYYNFVNSRSELFIFRPQTNVTARTVDGINWTQHTLPAGIISGMDTGGTYMAKRPGSNTYVYYRYNYISNNSANMCYTSTDLTNWTMQTVTTTNNNNLNSGGGGILGCTGNYFWWKGGNNDSSQPNWAYSTNGYNWNAYTWDADFTSPAGNFNTHFLSTESTWYAGRYSYSGNNYNAVRYGTFWLSSNWSVSQLGNNAYAASLTPYSVAGVSNIAPTPFAGIDNLQPTGGSSGVPSAGGDGGNGGSYIAPTAKSTVNSAAATPGQVPGAGGGGGGAGSTTGAAGANGLVSIKYYG